ncbi:MAG: ECF-type sigma factor [Bryobacteraceae bacterium]|jgi:RNA polymerase sigma factor (TIGR02999 family)
MPAPNPTHLLTGNDTFESIYGALRAQARQYLRREQNAYSMSPTVLVHEAWISLARARRLHVNDSSHYVRLVSRVMKNLLIDRARRKRAAANGGAMQRIEWNDAMAAPEDDSSLTLAVAAALEDLAVQSPGLAAIVELRYFGGFTETEVAQIIGVSTRTVRRQWRVARLRLLEILHSAGEPGSIQ